MSKLLNWQPQESLLFKQQQSVGSYFLGKCYPWWKSRRDTGRLWHLICSASPIPSQSHGLPNCSLVLFFSFVTPVPQLTHTHMLNVSFPHILTQSKRKKKKGHYGCIILTLFSHLNMLSFMTCPVWMWGCSSVWRMYVSENLLKAAVYCNAFMVMSVCYQALVIT